MTLEKLPQPAINILLNRLSDEQASFYFYISASAWCRLNGFENAARYLEVESHGEEYHFKRIVAFLSDWNASVNFPAISEPIKSFTGLQDILEQAYKMEFKLYKTYEKDAITIFPICQNTYGLLFSFVQVQNESVVSAAAILNKLKNYLETDPGLMIFDKEVFEQFQNIAY